MKTSYEYVGLVNYQYLKENFWKDAIVKKACFYTSHNAEGNLSTVNPWLKCVILLQTKREEKLPHDNIPQCILGPALSAF